MPDTMTPIARLICQRRIDLWDPTDRESSYELVDLIEDMDGLGMLPWHALSFAREDQVGNPAIGLAVYRPNRVGLASDLVSCVRLLDNPHGLSGSDLAELLVARVRAIGDSLIATAELHAIAAVL